MKKSVKKIRVTPAGTRSPGGELAGGIRLRMEGKRVILEADLELDRFGKLDRGEAKVKFKF